ncbi:MAG: hypothetical protein WDN26_10185 [Chitinophagaceae bacterium]
MRRFPRPVRFLLFIPLFVLGIFVIGWVVMSLWNNVLVPVLHVSAVTFWQGLGILALSKILFSSFGGRGGSRRDQWKRRMMWNSMTAEQKEKFMEEWKSRSHRWGHRGWDRFNETQQPGSPE